MDYTFKTQAAEGSLLRVCYLATQRFTVHTQCFYLFIALAGSCYQLCFPAVP